MVDARTRNFAPAIRRGGAIIPTGMIVVVAVATLVASLCAGARTLTPLEIWNALFGDGVAIHEAILLELRLPRTAAACLVGAALGSAGAILQGVTRNPVASPGLIGINAGAALALVIAAVGLENTSAPVQQLAAFLGAGFAVALTFLLTGMVRTPARLAIAGAAVSLFLSALTTAILITDNQSIEEIRFWLAGAVWRADWDSINAALVVILPGIFVAFAGASYLTVLSLGSRMASALGVQVGVIEVTLCLAALLLAGGAVTIAGPVGFVGLIGPHLARQIVGCDYRRVLPSSALIGALLTIAADTLGRSLFAPSEVPVSGVTAVIGAPYFLFLVRRITLSK